MRNQNKISFRLLAVSLIALFSLASCAKPTSHFPTFQPEGVYFKVPITWREITQSELAKQEAKSTAVGAAERAAAVKWQIAFTPNKEITAANVFSVSQVDNPIVFVRVRELYSNERNAISIDSLRDVVLPLSSWISGASSIPQFTLLVDEEIDLKGGSGLRSRFTFGLAETEGQTFEQRVLLSQDRKTLFVFIARCSDTCFAQNREVLDKIAESFTVNGK